MVCFELLCFALICFALICGGKPATHVGPQGTMPTSKAKQRNESKAKHNKEKHGKTNTTVRNETGAQGGPPRNQASKAQPSKETSKTIPNDTGAQGGPPRNPAGGAGPHLTPVPLDKINKNP